MELLRQGIEEFETLVTHLSNLISRGRELEDRLRRAFLSRRPAQPRKRRAPRKLMRLRAFALPQDVHISFGRGLSMRAGVVTNPSIVIEGECATLFLRVSTPATSFDHTLIAAARIGLDDLWGRIVLSCRPILVPVLPYENVEDPRALDRSTVFHVRGFAGPLNAVLTFIGLEQGDGFSVASLLIEFGNSIVALQDLRDTFAVHTQLAILRPYFRDLDTGGVFVGELRDLTTVVGESIRPLDPLLPANGEAKTGGNCCVRVSRDEYLLIYHVVDEHGVYRCYSAIIDGGGEIRALLPYPLIEPDPTLFRGRRPSTVFPCGAAIHRDTLLVAAGVDDEIAVVFEGSLSEILSEHVKRSS